VRFAQGRETRRKWNCQENGFDAEGALAEEK
jgi:hypothetical protein